MDDFDADDDHLNDDQQFSDTDSINGDLPPACSTTPASGQYNDLTEYQKINPYIKQLPNFELIKQEAKEVFDEIKENLVKSIFYNETRPGLLHWTTHLEDFLHQYGFFFSKQDHLKLIHIYLELIFTPDLDFPLVEHFSNILIKLLKRPEQLTRDDLQIKWRSIYDIYLRINSVNERSAVLAPENIENGLFNTFIRRARNYFPIESTQEMLNEWLPLLCPFDMSMSKAFERFELFLPTLVLPNEFDRGYRLWLEEFLALWLSMSSNHSLSTQMIALFARVSYHSIGYFDWNPYIPQIFNYILCGFGLPVVVGTKTGGSGSTSVQHSQKFTNTHVYSIALWVVSMIHAKSTCMEHIKRLFNTLRSFYYPSNTGRWSANLYTFLRLLPELLIQRVFKEKREKHKWFMAIPVEYRIKETEITEFVLSIKDCVFTAIFSKTHSTDAAKAFQSLSFLRPEHMLPHLTDNIYTSIESLTEPHRFITILNCMCLVARELVRYNKYCPTVQTHVIQLLTAVLPGIDGNDMEKSYTTFQFLSYVLTSIQIVDCSPATQVRSDLTDEEYTLCLQTENFENFLHEFFNKIFGMIEIFSGDFADAPMQYKTAVNTLDNAIDFGLQLTVNGIVQQSSVSLIKMLITKIQNYINGNVYNLKAGRLIVTICRSLVTSVLGAQAFKVFFEPVYDNLKRIKEAKNFDTLLANERGDIEVSWNMQLFSELLNANGTILLEYTSQIEDVINWYRKCTHKQTVQYICSSITNMLRSLVTHYPLERRLTPDLLDFQDVNSFKTHLPIRDWGRNGDLYNLNIKFHEPSKAELLYAFDFTNRYTALIMGYLKNEKNLNKHERLIEICLLNSILIGASPMLKRAKRPIVDDYIEANVQIGVGQNKNANLFAKQVDLPDERVREDLINFLLDYTDTLLSQHSDDTKSLIVIAKTLCLVSTRYSVSKMEHDRKAKIIQELKKKFENKLQGKHAYSRTLLIECVLLQLEFRSLHINTRLNDLDVKIIDCLFRLSTSLYSEVRKESQRQLFNMLSHYPFSFQLIVQKICNLLNDKNVDHDALKGCLYILKGKTAQSSLTVRPNWSIIGQVWPALYKCTAYEKPSISVLIEHIYENINKNFDTFSCTTKLNQTCLTLALDLYTNSFLEANKANELERFKLFNAKVKETYDVTHGVVRDVQQLLAPQQQQQTSWKNQKISFGLLIFLFHPYGKLTRDYVDLFVQTLVHDNVMMRKISIAGMCIILKLLKPEKPKIEYEIHDLIRNTSEICVNRSCPGERDDNTWHHLSSNFQIVNTNAEWAAVKFLDKTYYGYNCWPLKVNVNQSTRQFESERNEVVRSIYESFRDEEFVSKLFRMMAVEKNEREKFDLKRFHFFKGLFRNFGELLIPNLIEKYLHELVCDKNKDTFEGSQKLASEICAAIIRGSKYWPLDKLKELWSKLSVLFDLVVERLSSETLAFWYNCFSTATEDQDPRRMWFYVNYFKNLVFKKLNEHQQTTSTFQISSCIYLTRAVLTQFEWRVPDIWTDLHELFKEKMNHPYKVVRDNIASCLTYSLTSDINLPNHSEIVTSAPKLRKFIDFINEKLKVSINLFKTVQESNKSDSEATATVAVLSDEQKSALNFVQTTLAWFTTNIMITRQPLQIDLVRLLPHLCSLDNIAVYDENMKPLLKQLRAYIVAWSIDSKCADFLVEQLKKVLEFENWHSKFAAIEIIQNFGCFNLFLLNDRIKSEIKEIITSNLTNEQLEIRLACSHTLTGFIHSSLIGVDADLINKFKKLSKKKTKVKDENGKMVLNMQNVIIRHGGILGICAIVSSSPYEISKELPDLITYLCDYINDPAPIHNTVRKCLSEFRRTHHDNWQEHQQYFNGDQLVTLNDVLVSPSYYA